MGRPSLLILDEPIAGLDVVEYESLKSLLFCFRGAVEGSGYFARRWLRSSVQIMSDALVVPAMVGWLFIMSCGWVLSGFSTTDARLTLVATGSLF